MTTVVFWVQCRAEGWRWVDEAAHGDYAPVTRLEILARQRQRHLHRPIYSLPTTWVEDAPARYQYPEATLWHCLAQMEEEGSVYGPPNLR